MARLVGPQVGAHSLNGTGSQVSFFHTVEVEAHQPAGVFRDAVVDARRGYAIGVSQGVVESGGIGVLGQVLRVDPPLQHAAQGFVDPVVDGEAPLVVEGCPVV